MKKLFFVLLLCMCVFGCDDMQKPIMDVISEPVTPVEETFGDVPRITIYAAAMQAKITGPWLWMIAPTDPGRGGFDTIDADSLAIASNDVIHEIDVATNGVAAGDMIGDLTWTPATIAGSSVERFSDNINDVVNKIGFAEGNVDEYSSYALINIVSDTDRPNLTMQVGSDDNVKVWLNGEVVHKFTRGRGTNDFQDVFMVDLKAGSNLLLVKVHDNLRQWAMFVGIQAPVELTEEPGTENTYLTFRKGSEPSPNIHGLAPKNDYLEWSDGRFQIWEHGDNTTHWGAPLEIGGTLFQRGISAHVYSRIVYNLENGYDRFETWVGLPNSGYKEGDHIPCGHGGSVEFFFKIDGVIVHNTGAVNSLDLDALIRGEVINVPPLHVIIDIPPTASVLEIEVTDAGDGDCADSWIMGNARLISNN